MAGQTEQKILWQARAAWASDQMKDGLSSDSGWRKLAAKNMKAGNQEERTYLALAKLKLLTDDLAQFKRMHFSKTNERPEANLGNKTRAMEEIERKAEMIIKIGTGKQILSARSILRSAYTDFAETMETAAVPSKLGSQEQEELKKSFMEFAKGFREKANLLEVKEETAQPSSSQIRKEEEMLSAVSLSKEESNWLEEGNIPAEKAAEIYAKKAISLFQDGKYGDARYFGEKWRKTASAGAPPGFGEKDFEKFQAQLVEKIPAVDPLSQDL